MAAIAFIGLGNMGLPMARNLLKAGHQVVGYDVVPAARDAAGNAGAGTAGSVPEAVAGAECVITMLPEGRHVRDVYLGDDGVIARAEPEALLIDCSTVDVDSARMVNRAAGEHGSEVLDAPVSGGVAGAENATLTFMVGGSEQGVARARPVLERMGKAVVHAGPSGSDSLLGLRRSRPDPPRREGNRMGGERRGDQQERDDENGARRDLGARARERRKQDEDGPGPGDEPRGVQLLEDLGFPEHPVEPDRSERQTEQEQSATDRAQDGLDHEDLRRRRVT